MHYNQCLIEIKMGNLEAAKKALEFTAPLEIRHKRGDMLSWEKLEWFAERGRRGDIGDNAEDAELHKYRIFKNFNIN